MRERVHINIHIFLCVDVLKVMKWTNVFEKRSHCQARESNPGLQCRSVMFYHCSKERCWTQVRSTTKVTKNSPLFQEQQQKSLAYRSQKKGSWKEKQFQKIKYLEEQKILSVGDRCYLQSMAKITQNAEKQILKNLQRSQRHKHSSIIQQESDKERTK